MKIYLLKVELGYIGYDMTCLIGAESENISERATEAALEHYYSYDGTKDYEAPYWDSCGVRLGEDE